MELQFPLIFTFLLLCLPLMIIVMRKGKRARFPPGPTKLPIIGNLHNLMMGGLPHHSLRRLAKEYGPLMHLKLGEVSTVIISSPEMAKEIMKTHDLKFVGRPELLAVTIMLYNSTSVVSSPYGPYWRQLRKICTLELLTAKRVQSFRSQREEEMSNLIGSITESLTSPATVGEMVVNFSEKVNSLSNDMIARAAFGKKCKDKHVFLSSMEEVLKFISGFDVVELFPSQRYLQVISGTKAKLMKFHENVDKILNDIIEDHKVKKTSDSDNGDSEEDLVDVLLRLKESGDLEVPFTNDNMKAIILDIFTAGSETIAIALEWAMAELIKCPSAMEKVQTEVREVIKGKTHVDESEIHKLSYLKLVIKETLRMHPPAPLLAPRVCVEDCEINGYEIPKSTRVIVNAWALGRDPQYWENAECFQPERFDGNDIDYKGDKFEYIPFGGGRRICPGILFGIANIELPLAQLLYHFDWKLPNCAKPEELDMTEAFGGMSKPKNHLKLVPTLYPHMPVRKD
ncbi:hypothetical protein GIB67_033568 [Kingdonia uniflora]|uniref:Cytochrome P450 n=1 Tax=Kingdonia uniflora TaxID=39325 RepID=A0A7J7L6F7_9MAGN|nr:hypothetical protein GIB67_033568 [Kingdonia uniflora]